MMKYILPVFMSLLLLGCSREFSHEITDEHTDLSVMAGSVRIRVTEDFAKTIEEDKGQDIRDVLGAVSVSRTFPYCGRFEERTKAEGLHLWYDVTFNPDIPVTKASTDLANLKGIIYVEKRQTVRPANFNDPFLSRQWHYINTGSLPNSRAGADINVAEAWKYYTTGDKKVIVSVVDGGIDYAHEDLAGNIWMNTAEFYGVKGYDDDGNGYKDDIYGFNFVSMASLIVPHDHGTHVAGTIGAMNNNGKGVCGVAGGDETHGGVRLMSCQIFVGEDNEYADQNANSAEAIKYGADNGAVISQNSWGYKGAEAIGESDKAAIDYFIKYAGIDENGNQTGPMKGGIVIFAAGNDESEKAYPASYGPVLSVAAIAPDYTLAYYSNYGSWVDLSAPGGSVYYSNGTIYSTLPNNSYGTMQGTSMACPHVSGVAALIVSKYGGPGFTPDMLEARIKNSAVNIDSYNKAYAQKMGVGLVNAYGALAAWSTTPPEKPGNIRGNTLGNTVSLSWTIPTDGDDSKPHGFAVYYSKSPLTDLDRNNVPENIKIRIFNTGDLEAGDIYTAVIGSLDYSTTYYFVIDAFDYSSNRSDLSSEISLITDNNTAPVITPVNGTHVDVKAFESKTLNFMYSDPEGHPTRWIFEPGSEAATAINFSGSIQVIVNGTKALPGDYSARLTVLDSYGASAYIDITYSIFPNTPPVVSAIIENLHMNSIGAKISIPLNDHFFDADGETLSYSITNSQPGIVHVSANDNLLYITSLAYGLSEVSINASDALGEQCGLSLKILVRDASQEVDVYPNPVRDILYLRTGSKTDADVNITGVSGASVYNKKVTIDPFEPANIDMTGISAGFYSVKIKTGDKVITRKIVKL